MRIAGLDKSSFVDYPGKVAATIFTPGCNLDCFYCQNRHLLGPDQPDSTYDPQAVLEFLRKRRGLLGGVVISGGEPTLQRDLPDFIRDVRALGYPVKLDTNGTRPWILRALLDANLLDFVAMDIKAPLSRYAEIVGRDINLDAVSESIDLLLAGSVEYEFRTTFAPQLSTIDILTIATRIHGAKRYVLQQYRPPGLEMNLFGVADAPRPRPPAYIREAAGLADRLVEECTIRGLGPVPRETTETCELPAEAIRSTPATTSHSL